MSLVPSALSTCLFGILGYVGYTYKKDQENKEARMAAIEEKLSTRITEESVRQIIADKIGPVREDLKEIKEQLNKVTDSISPYQIRKGR